MKLHKNIFWCSDSINLRDGKIPYLFIAQVDIVWAPDDVFVELHLPFIYAFLNETFLNDISIRLLPESTLFAKLILYQIFQQNRPNIITVWVNYSI